MKFSKDVGTCDLGFASLFRTFRFRLQFWGSSCFVIYNLSDITLNSNQPGRTMLSGLLRALILKPVDTDWYCDNERVLKLGSDVSIEFSNVGKKRGAVCTTNEGKSPPPCSPATV